MILKYRSILFAMVGGMMAAALLHNEGTLDLGFGFPRGGLIEGAMVAIAGSLAGCAFLLAYRKFRNLAGRDTE